MKRFPVKEHWQRNCSHGVLDKEYNSDKSLVNQLMYLVENWKDLAKDWAVACRSESAE